MMHETKKKSVTLHSKNLDDPAKHKRKSVDNGSNIIQFVAPIKKKKLENKSDLNSDQNYSDPIVSKREKKLRFDVEDDVQSKGVPDVNENKSEVKKKIRKPRWSEERKQGERKRKAEEPIEVKEEVDTPRSKKKKRRKKKQSAVKQTSTSSLAISAIQYLQNWQYDRSNWKFSKIKQTWLLKHIFDVQKIPSSKFPVLVEYISASKGGARSKTYEAASKVIQKLEDKVASREEKVSNGNLVQDEEVANCLEGEESEEDKEEIHRRARSIMQTLSDCT